MEKTLREAAELVADQVFFLKAIAEALAELDPKWRGNTYEPYFKPIIIPKLDDLRAALENTQGEDREADRPDAEKALEELAAYMGPDLLYHIRFSEEFEFDPVETPHLAAWLKSRERGA